MVLRGFLALFTCAVGAADPGTGGPAAVAVDPSRTFQTIDSPTSYSLLKRYYCFKRWSSHVRPGAVRIAADSDDPDLRVAAFQQDGRIVLVAFNRSQREIPASFSGMADGKVEGVRTSETHDWEPLDGGQADDGRFETTIPARSLQTFFASSK